MMMTTTMMMISPPKKARLNNYYSQMETDRPFLNNNNSSSNSNSSGGSGIHHDGSSSGSVLQSSHGSPMFREEFRVAGPHPNVQSRAAVPQPCPSQWTAFHPFPQETSKPNGFLLAGPDPSTMQRASRAFNIEPQSLRVNAIELPLGQNITTPPRGAEPNDDDDAPLDLSTLSADDYLRRNLDDQTFPRSGNNSSNPNNTGRSPSSGVGFDDSRRPESDVERGSVERPATPQLPLFVNLENSRLESIQRGLQSTRRGHGRAAEKENDGTKLLDPAMWQTTTTMMTTKDWDTESDVEPAPRRQKKAIDELRAHLERRQEGRPTTTSSGAAYASLSKHLEAIEAAANRYDAVHGTSFGQLQEVKATRSKTSFRSITETDVQGRGWSDDFRYEKETPEVPDQQKQRCLSGLTIDGLQQKQNDQRLKETKLFCLQDVTRRNREPIGDGGAVTMETDNSTSWKCPPASGVATDNSMRFAQTIDFQPQDRIPSDLHPSRLQNFSASNPASWTNPFTCAAVEPEPDSPSSHSLPDLYRRSSLAVSTQSLTLRRPASTDTGFPSSEYRLTKNHSAAIVMDMGGNGDGGGGGCTVKPCSPDQSTNYMNYSADNLPSIIASARLDDDCEFISSFAEPRKETIAKDNHHPVNRSQNASFRSRRNAINSGTVGTGFNSGTAGIGFNSGTVGIEFSSGTVGIGFSSGTAGTGINSGTVGTGFNSSPEPPSSTFEDDTMADKSKYEDNNNAKATDSAIPCKICQDVANGFHYGVWSCEGCKAFFKRSITGSAKYVCPADNNCTINRLRKKSCQACRLRKCYEYGMSPGNCRGENGSKTRKRRLQEADRKEDSKNSINGDDIRMHNMPSNQRFSGSFLPVQNVPHSFQSHPTVTVPASGPAGILQHLLAVERPIRFADFVDVRTVVDAGDAERIRLVASITKLVNLQLTDVVTWSRNLPGFSALNLNVRTHLLVSSWSEVLLLTNAFYSLQCTNAIAIAPNLHLTKERCEVIGMLALYNRLMAIVKSFQQLALTHNEMLLMQVLLLVNADLTAPQLIPLLDGLRSSLMQSWHQSSASSGQGQGQGQGHVDHDRISRLLMLLPHIRHCSLLFQRFLSDFRRDSRIPFNGFLQEVTDGRHQFDEVSVLELLVEAEEEGAGLHASVH